MRNELALPVPNTTLRRHASTSSRRVPERVDCKPAYWRRRPELEPLPWRAQTATSKSTSMKNIAEPDTERHNYSTTMAMRRKSASYSSWVRCMSRKSPCQTVVRGAWCACVCSVLWTTPTRTQSTNKSISRKLLLARSATASRS